MESAPPAGIRPNRIVRGAATYVLSSVLQRTIQFFLLPIFVRFLTPGEFGQIGILTTLVAAFGVVVSLGLETAVFRGYLRLADDEVARRNFVRTVGSFGIAVPLLASFAVATFATSSLAMLLDVPADAARLALVGAALNAAATSVPLAVLRGQERLRAYLQLTGLQVIVTPLLTVLFVVILGWGPTGWMLAYALGAGTLLVRATLVLREEWRGRLDARLLRGALALGLPLVPHSASHWALAASDRAILGAFLPSSAVGAYYAAFLFSLPVNVLAIAISQATQPAFADAANSSGARSRLGPLSAAQAAVVAWSAGVVALVGPPIIRLLFPPDYAPAADYVPWLAAGAALFGLYLMPMNAISITAGRTGLVWPITGSAALANVTLNLLLVPRFGALAAAINTTIGYGMLLIGVFLYSRVVCQPPIRYELPRIYLELLVIAAAFLLGIVLIPADSVAGLAGRVAIAVLIAVAGFAIGPFRQQLRDVATSLRMARNRGNP